ncbi:mitohcondrial RNA polymerase, partial [Scheffersomyces stipitis CBS 6054]
RTPNIHTSILINSFFQSVMQNDFNRSRKLLEKLRNKINTPDVKMASIHRVNYYSCFSLLLSNLISQGKVHIQNIKLLVDEATNEMNQLRTEIRSKLVLCVVNSLDDGVKYGGIYQQSIAKYAGALIKNFHIKPSQLAQEITKKETLDKLNRICAINSLTPKELPWVERVTSAIDNFKDDNGYVSLENLCRYIGYTRFANYDSNDSHKLKMFEIYDSLSTEKERADFIDNYLDFNKTREMILESNCLDLVENFDSIHLSKSRELQSIGHFKLIHSKMIYSWFESNVKELQRLKSKLKTVSVTTNLNEQEKILTKYLTYLELIPERALVTLFLSNMLSMTISSKEGGVKVVTLTKSLLSLFTRLLMKDKSFTNVKKTLLEFFNDKNDAARLIGALIDIFIHNCKFKIPPQQFEEFVQAQQLLRQYVEGDYKKDSHDNFDSFHSTLVPLEGKKTVGILRIHSYLYQQFKIYDSLAFNKSLYFPMLYPPKPWVSPTNGGYLLDLKPIITSSDIKTSMKYIDRANSSGQLNSTYEALNYLGSNAWAINSEVLQVFNEVMKLDEGFLKIPPTLKVLKTEEQEDYNDLKTKRILFNLVHVVANSYDVNGDMLFLPHNVDFRGRAYPMASLLTHYQEDAVRGIMMFWHSQPLGSTGLNWLKYQLAGVFGKDKLSFENRIQFVDENLESIRESAENPLSKNSWWKEADKPWQTLALCIELNRAYNYVEQGNKIEEFRSRMPVHQDGSCNGLQHYAALGADTAGGEAVNIVPNKENLSQRGDVYSSVLQIVIEKVQKDLTGEGNSDSSNSNFELSSIAMQILNRKLIKQTVMTTVYGVTTYGGASQIYLRIKDLIQEHEIKLHNDEKIDLEFLEKLRRYRRPLSLYLSKYVLNSISELFSGARIIQDWLVDNCFRAINSFDLETVDFIRHKSTTNNIPSFSSHTSFKPMMWTSLSGFPIVQLYKHSKSDVIPTSLQSISINKPQEIAPINKKKQMNAIAPNFIHSIDSIHMLMTCVAAKKANIPFVSVHDSFWTYPNHVDELSVLLREEFVRLHSSNIAENLREDLLYTMSKSFQLVWVYRAENAQLVDEIKELRKTYDISSYGGGTKIDKILYHELRQMTNDNSTGDKPFNRESTQSVQKILDKHNPTLYFRSRYNPKLVQQYDSSLESKLTKTFNRKEFTPVLVPVSILNCPPTGELDLSEVMKSRYFFS